MTSPKHMTSPEFPADWHRCRIKDALDFFNTKRIPLSAAERGVMVDRRYDYYGASGVIDQVEGYLFDGTYILLGEDGANLLSRSKPLAFLATGQFWVNNHAHILKPRCGGLDRFFVDLLESLDYSTYVTGAAQPKLTMENLGRFRIGVPPRAEQQRIAAYLDASCEAIDTAVAAKRSQLDTLDAMVLAAIHDAVTKGIRPEAKLKPSGLDWNPLTPSHWDERQKRPRSGITGNKIVAGNLRHRLPIRIAQLEKTYDLMSLNADQLIELLGEEFSFARPKTAKLFDEVVH